MATFWERAAHSVEHMFSLNLTIIFVISRIGIEGGICVLIAPVPDHCLLVSYLCDMLFSETLNRNLMQLN